MPFHNGAETALHGTWTALDGARWHLTAPGTIAGGALLVLVCGCVGATAKW